MKFYLVFAAVLLSAVSAKVMPMPEDVKKVQDVSVPIEEAQVVELPKDHVEPMPVVDKIPATSPPVPVVEEKNAEIPPVVEMPEVPEVTQLSPVPSTVPVSAEVPAVLVSTTTVAKDASMIDDPSRCDILCTKFELNPVCGVGATCVHEFPNQCTMDTFNCLHPNMAFKSVKEERCKTHWLPQCTDEEMHIGV